MKTQDYKMHIVLLCGGSGKRLWPISTENYPKQFLKLINYNGKKVSMLQRTYQMIKKLGYNISVVTDKNYYPIVKKQINNIDIIKEPKKRNTFPAISLSVVANHFNKKYKSDFIAFLPIDAYVEKDFYSNITKLEKQMIELKTNFGILGIKPNYPSTEYGYIKKQNMMVEKFIEKPNKETAEKLIKEGYLFNSGIVIVETSNMIKQLKKKYVKFNNLEDFTKQYLKLPMTSFDYEILEKEKNICCLEVKENWMDIGIYKNFLKILKDNKYGKVYSSSDKETIIINNLNIPIISANNNNLFIGASEEGILVCDKNKKIPTKLFDDSKKKKKNYNESGYTQKITKTLDVIYIEEKKQIKKTIQNKTIINVIEGKGLITTKKYTKILKKGVTIEIENDTAIIKAQTKLKVLKIIVTNKNEKN